MKDLDEFRELLEELLADYDYKLVMIDDNIEQDIKPVYNIGNNTPTLVSGPLYQTLKISAIRTNS